MLEGVNVQTVDILDLYKSAGGYLEGHFLLASGRHSPKFLQSTTVMQHPHHTQAIGEAIAAQFDTVPDFVIGPAMGGIMLAHAVASAMGCRALFAEKDGEGGMFIREAFAVKESETFIAVEDVMTTGGSLKKTIIAAKSYGARCIGIGCIIDRGLANLEPSPKALMKLEFPTYPADNCPLCDEGVALEEV